MDREGRTTSHRWPIIFGGLGLLIALAVAGWWFVGPKFWTDSRFIRVADRDAKLREVLWTPPQALGAPFDGDTQRYEPSLSPDGSEFFFVVGKPGHKARIYVSYRKNNKWGDAILFGQADGLYDDLGPRLTPDGNTLLFYSDRPGGFGGYDIWGARRTEKGWGTPFNLGPQVNSEFNEFSPDPTPDGKHLIFATNRKSSNLQQKQAWQATIRQTMSSDYDLWMADIVSNAPATQPSAPATQPISPFVFKPAGEIPGINTPYVEGASCMSPAGDFLYFSSNRPGGYGKFDIWRSRVTTNPEGSWSFGTVENLGPQINTADNETDPSMALNGYRMFFSSDRDSGDGIYHLLISDSREVYPLHQLRHGPALGLSFWLMLLSLIALIPLLMFLRGWEDSRLSTLQRCLLLSLLVHVAICFALTFMKVTAQAYHYVHEGAGGDTVVALSAPRDADIGFAIRQQSSSDLQVGSAGPVEIGKTAAQPTEIIERPQAVSINAGQTRLAPSPADMAIDLPTSLLAAPSHTDAVQASANLGGARSLDVQLPASKTVSQPEMTPDPSAHAIVPQSAQASIQTTVRAETDGVAKSVTAPPRQLQIASSVTESLAPTGNVPSATSAGVATAQAVLPAAAPTSPGGIETSAIVNGPKLSSAASDAPTTVGPPSKVERQSTASGAQARAPQIAAPAIDATSTSARSSLAASAPEANFTAPFNALTSSAPQPSTSSALSSILAPSIAQPAPATNKRIADSQAGPQDHEFVAPTTQPIAGPSVARATGHRTADSTVVGAPASSAAKAMAGSHESLELSGISSPRSNTVHDAIQPSPMASAALGSAQDFPVVSLPQSLASSGQKNSGNSSAEKSVSPDAVMLASSPVAPADHQTGPREISSASTPAPPAVAKIAEGNFPITNLEGHPAPAALPSAQVAPQISFPGEPPALSFNSLPAPQSAFRMRDPEVHKPILKELGGTKESENAVDRALVWLASVQEPEGRWGYITTNRHRRAAADHPHDMACTGLATLAFLAQGHSPAKAGPYQDNVTRALDFLVSKQLDDGDLRGPMRGGGADMGNMYDQGIATFALAEAAIMSHDPKYTQAALAGAKFIVEAQNEETGGWRYIPREQGDSSVFGWQIMALHSAEQIGFEIPNDCRIGMLRYIKMASSGQHEMLAGYQPHNGPMPPMTAEIAFCRMLLGQQFTEDEANEVCDFLGNQPPNRGESDIYYWYYGSLCMMQMQNDAWKNWNTQVRDTLIRMQHHVGNDSGYWEGMRWGDRGGHVFTTAMATLTLEVYYRYMPLQQKTEHASDENTAKQ